MAAVSLRYGAASAVRGRRVVAARRRPCARAATTRRGATGARVAVVTVALHDFCLVVPYGALVAAGGLAGYLLKGSVPSLVAGGGSGAALVALGFASLSAWQARRSCAPFTAGSLAVAAALLAVMGRRVLDGAKFMPSGLVAGLSLAMCAFLAYNLVSGGNTPKAPEAAAEA